MNYISPEQLKQIQEQSNIVEYIAQYVKLRKSGHDYSGLCPFHNEKTPSFHVSEEKQVFHCFGCGRSGNIFQFASQYEHLSFPEAVAKVAQFFHVPFESIEKSQSPNSQYLNQLKQMHDKAEQFYQHLLLNTKQGEQALSYLQQRGMTLETIKTFGIGYAPPKTDLDLLVTIFQDDDLTEQSYADSGLFIIDNNGAPHDRFYDRIMFPLKNEAGQTIAFSGRRLSEDKTIPKYLNSPETKLFNKSTVLFNLDLAKANIREQKQAILFEGYMDVISAYQAGVKNGIASMGTSLTKQHINKIQQLTNDILVCYDGDDAGIEASYRVYEELAENAQISLNFVWIPDKLDPDEYIKMHSPEDFRTMIENTSLSKIHFLMRYLKLNLNINKDQDKVVYTERIIQALNQLKSPVEQNIYLQELADEVNVNIDVLAQQINNKQQLTKRTQEPNIVSQADSSFEPAFSDELVNLAQPAELPQKPMSKVEKAEYNLLYRVIFEKNVRDKLKDIQFVFPDIELEELYVLIDDYLQWHQTFDELDFSRQLQTLKHQQLLDSILSLTISQTSTPQEIDDYIYIIQNSKLEHQLYSKRQELNEASKMGNLVLEKKLSSEIFEIIMKIKNRGKGHA